MPNNQLLITIMTVTRNFNLATFLLAFASDLEIGKIQKEKKNK